ncbi:MAG: NfeD family protein [Pseudoflavonifractor sp.]
MDLTPYLPSIVWLVALIVFAVAEAITVGLTSTWFALGSLCALIVSVCSDNLVLQGGVFLGVSLVSLVLLRPLAKKYMVPKPSATNADRAIGREAVVTEEINNLQGRGGATVAGVHWTARSDDDAVIPAETIVRVLRIEGAKLIVTKI